MVNEEMYEEEDDDLPYQYRRLTAHLQTGSPDFNRRLSAYLTNHVAMRSALDQAITTSYAQEYPNAPQFAHNHQNLYPSPFFAHHLPQQQLQQSQHQPPPPPQPFVQPSYNILTGTPSFRSVQQMRSASMAGSHGMPMLDPNIATASPVQATPQVDQRDSSTSMKPPSPSEPTPTRPTPQLTNSPTALSHSPPPPSGKMMSPAYPTKSDQGCQTSPSQMYASPFLRPSHQSYGILGGYPSFGPLTTALPMESQLMLGPVLDPSDPMTSMFMAGSENMIQPFYNPTSPLQMKTHQLHPAYDGMSATLAPSALDMPIQSLNNLPSAGSASMSAPFASSLDSGLSDLKGPTFTRSSSSQGSGTGTPGLDAGWDAFINDNSWNENSV